MLRYACFAGLIHPHTSVTGITSITSKYMPFQGFQFTTGDLDILSYVYHYRLTTVDHLQSLTGRPVSTIQRRLRYLSTAGYLYRRPLPFQRTLYLTGQ